MTNKNNTLKYIFLNLFWFILIAFLSYKMPDYVDDSLHRLSFADGSHIESVSQIFPSVATYYMTWGGRAVSMFFIQLMLMLPKVFFVVINGLIYVAVANVICHYAEDSVAFGGEKSGNSAGKLNNDNGSIEELLTLSAIYLFMWFFMPDFAEVITWITGTVTYLWTNLAILGFGLLYYGYFRKVVASDRDGNVSGIGGNSFDKANGNQADMVMTTGKKIGLSVCYICLGFFAGLSNEAGSCTIILALVFFFVYMIYTKHSIRIYQVLGAISCAIGAGLLILAPGNAVRTEVSVAESSAGRNIFIEYAFRIGREGFYSMTFLMIPFAIGLALSIFNHLRNKKDVRGKKKLQVATIEVITSDCLFYIFAFVSVFVMTFSAGFANRIFQLPVLFICIGFACSLLQIIRRRETDAADDSSFLALRKSLGALVIALTIMAAFEVVAGSMYSAAKGTFFDRQTIYYNIYDTEGVLSGNGL